MTTIRNVSGTNDRCETSVYLYTFTWIYVRPDFQSSFHVSVEARVVHHFAHCRVYSVTVPHFDNTRKQLAFEFKTILGNNAAFQYAVDMNVFKPSG